MAISYKESQKNKTMFEYLNHNCPLVIEDDIEKLEMGEKRMASIKEEAKEFKPMQTKNIAELKEVSVDLEIFDREGKNNDGEVFKYKVVVVDGEDYRIPGIVIGNLKAILEKKPDLKTFSVSRKGTGLQTQYTLIPMD